MNKLNIFVIYCLVLIVITLNSCKVDDMNIKGDNKELSESILSDINTVYRSFQVANMVAFRNNIYLKDIFDVDFDTSSNFITAHIGFKSNPTNMLNHIYEHTSTSGTIDVIFKKPLVNNIEQTVIFNNFISNGAIYNGTLTFIKTNVLNQYLINTDSLTVNSKGKIYLLKTRFISDEQYSSSFGYLAGSIEQYNGKKTKINIIEPFKSNNDYTFSFNSNNFLAFESGKAILTNESLKANIMLATSAKSYGTNFKELGEYNFFSQDEKTRYFGRFPIY